MIAYLLPLPDKNPTTAVVKYDKTGQKRSSKMLALRLQAARTLITKGSILSFVVMSASEDFLYLTTVMCMK